MWIDLQGPRQSSSLPRKSSQWWTAHTQAGDTRGMIWFLINKKFGLWKKKESQEISLYCLFSYLIRKGSRNTFKICLSPVHKCCFGHLHSSTCFSAWIVAHAEIAQLGERQTEDLKVPGSNPESSVWTLNSPGSRQVFLFFFFLPVVSYAFSRAPYNFRTTVDVEFEMALFKRITCRRIKWPFSDIGIQVKWLWKQTHYRGMKNSFRKVTSVSLNCSQ